MSRLERIVTHLIPGGDLAGINYPDEGQRAVDEYVSPHGGANREFVVREKVRIQVNRVQ